MRQALLVIAFITGIFLCSTAASAQSPANLEQLSKKYAGTWYNKENKRYIRFFFEEGYDYVTINDWTGKLRNQGSGDAYKAFIKGDKLVMPAENDDHHATYCEIEIMNDTLVYICNSGLNFTDNFLNKSKPLDKTIFKRIKE